MRPRALLPVLAAALLPLVGAAPAALPFGVGEELVFSMRSHRFGALGTGVMRVDGPEELRGERAWLLRFDYRGRIGPVSAEDRTRSWLVPGRMSSLRYRKHERTPLGSRSEEVELFPAERRWEAPGRASGRSPTDAPLDELSFLYFLRTLPLRDGAVYTLDRHFDPERNPVVVRVVGRTRLSVPAGEFSTVEVVMEVKAPAHAKGKRGVVQLHLTDDARRTPVRIESTAPLLGVVVLSLRSHTPAPGR